MLHLQYSLMSDLRIGACTGIHGKILEQVKQDKPGELEKRMKKQICSKMHIWI